MPTYVPTRVPIYLRRYLFSNNIPYLPEVLSYIRTIGLAYYKL